MNYRTASRVLCLLAAVAVVSACGGKTSSSNTTTAANGGTTTSQGASPGAMAGASPGAGTMMSGTQAPIPASLKCGATKPVWVNTRRHTYHLASDPAYGRTRHGKYMCPSAAAAEGDHPAGRASGTMHRHHHGSAPALQ